MSRVPFSCPAYQTAFHALTTYTDALGGVVTLAYSATTGLLTSVQDQVGRYTTYTQDSSRRETSVTTVLGTTSYTYDTTTGEIATIKDALNHVTTLGHDTAGRLTSQTTADGYTESWAFNSSGQLASHTDKSGVV